MTHDTSTRNGFRALLVLGAVMAGLATAASGQQAGNLVLQGREAFFAQGCHGCHTLEGAGTPIAYDLSHIGAKYSRAELERWLRDPRAQKPTAHMPRIVMTGQEVRALAAYLSSLR